MASQVISRALEGAAPGIGRTQRAPRALWHLGVFDFPVLVFILGAACNKPLPTPKQVQCDQSAPAVESWSATTLQEPYRIQVGDVLEIKFLYQTNLADTVRVRPDGRISLTPIDDIMAAGRQPAELDQVLTEMFSRYVNDPDLSVIVREFGARRAYVGGEVAKPGVIEMVGATSLLSAIMAAGGAEPTAELRSVILIRAGSEGKPQAMRVDVRGILAGRPNDLLLHGYDIVYVPRTAIAEVDLFVEQYINRVVPRLLGFNLIYNLNPDINVNSDTRSRR